MWWIIAREQRLCGTPRPINSLIHQCPGGPWDGRYLMDHVSDLDSFLSAFVFSLMWSELCKTHLFILNYFSQNYLNIMHSFHLKVSSCLHWSLRISYGSYNIFSFGVLLEVMELLKLLELLFEKRSFRRIKCINTYLCVWCFINSSYCSIVIFQLWTE